MGTLTYDGDTITFEDRTLAHLQAAITTKLRRREPRYEFDSAEPGRLNGAWLNSMVEMAGRTSGLLVTEEPKDLSEYRDRRGRVGERSIAAS